MSISVLVAIGKNQVIGIDGRLPWRLPADLEYFKSLTMDHVVIMGRKTYESIGKPLNGRVNIIVTKQVLENCLTATSLEAALKLAKDRNSEEKEIFIIGGERLYQEAIEIADRLYVTFVKEDFEGDKFFPDINPKIWREMSRKIRLKDKDNQFDMDFVVFDKI